MNKIGFRTLLKNSKKNSLYGMQARRDLGFLLFAGLMLMLLGVMCMMTDTTAGAIVGTSLATITPLAIIMPKSAKELIAEKKAKLLKDFMKHFKALDDEGAAMLEDIQNQINSIFDMAQADNEAQIQIFNALQTTLNELQAKLPTEESAAAAAVDMKAVKDAIADLKLGGIGGRAGAEKAFKVQLKEFMDSDEFKAAIKSGRNVAIQVKAATTITTANASGAPHGLSFEIVPGIQEKPREQNVILAALNKGNTTSRTIIWINRVDKEGGSAFVAEGALKPLKDWTYEEATSIAKKCAVSTKVSTEMLQDFEYMESEIRNLLSDDLMTFVDQKLVTGTGTGDEILGIIPGAAAYTGTGLDGTITNPNNADAIRAVILQMRMLNYKPDICFMNPTDVASLDLLKTTDGHYIKVETDAVTQYIPIVETTEVESGKFVIMDTAKWFVRILKDLEIQFGWENDDFRKNLVTIIAELRLHSYKNSIDTGAVVSDEFATVKTALKTA
jgi:HK97 family phage major capsid protein